MQNSNYIRKNIQEEKSHFSNQVESLKQVVGKFETAGFFQQLESLEKQNNNLQRTVENTLFKHFLLVLELERRAHAFDSLSIKHEQLLVKSEEERKQYIATVQNNRKKLESEINSRLGSELDGLNQAHKNEVMKYEERIRELQNQMATKESQIDRLSETINKKDTERSQWANRCKDLERGIQDLQHEKQLAISQLKVNQEDQMRKIQENHKHQLNKIRSDFDQKYNIDLKNLKADLENNFNRQIGDKNNSIKSLQSEIGRCHGEIQNLSQNLDSINQRYLGANDQTDKLRDQIEQIKATNSQTIMRLKQEFEEKMQQELYTKEASLKQEHKANLTQLERQLKAQKDMVLKLEKNESYLINERDRLSRQLNDATKDMEEWRSKYQEIKVNSERHIQQLTIEKTTIINNNQSEIERLKLQINSVQKVHDTEKASLNQDIQELGQQIKSYRIELENQIKINEKRKQEIESWKNNYSHFVTADQVDNMKNEIKKLRSEKMELEDSNIRINNQLKKAIKDKNNLAADIDDIKSHLEDQNRLNEKRKSELIEAQSIIDKLENQLRGANKDKLDIDAEKMMTLEDHNRILNELKNAKSLAEHHRNNAEKYKMMLHEKTTELSNQINVLQKYEQRDISPDKYVKQTQRITESIHQPSLKGSHHHYINQENKYENYHH